MQWLVSWGSMMETRVSTDRVRFGLFELDMKTRELTKDKQPLQLQEQPFKLLVLFLTANAGKVSRQQIGETLWPGNVNVDVDGSINAAVKNLRRVLNDPPDAPEYIQTSRGEGYKLLKSPEWIEPAKVEPSRTSIQHWVMALVALLLIAGIGLFHYRSRSKALPERAFVVLSDFDNKTGDLVFNDTLRQGLSLQLQQSPYLQLLSEDSIGRELSMMSKPKNTRLNPEIAREICQRTRSAAVIEGSIEQVGSEYVVETEALGCQTGETLASSQGIAKNKDRVLDALSHATTDLRKQLGESKLSVQKYDVPLANATTASLEALREYTIGLKALDVYNFAEAIKAGQRAVQLDPNFAQAYLLQGIAYSDVNEGEKSAENVRAAYKLRDRVSERERLQIEAQYSMSVTGNLEIARSDYERWNELYPFDDNAKNQLGTISFATGDYEGGLRDFQDALRIDPQSTMYYVNVATAFVFLNRPEQAERVLHDAESKHLDNPAYHSVYYLTAYQQQDKTRMAEESKHFIGKPGWDDQLWEFESDSAADKGHFKEARELSQTAAASARRVGEKEVAASYQAESALRDAMAGFIEPAKQQATEALAASKGSEVEAMAAIALALAGDTAASERIRADLSRRFPEDTIVQFNFIPVIRTTSLLHKDPAQALQEIIPTEHYELGYVGNGATFNAYPVYFHGEALLATHQGAQAAVEFQKVLDHQGIVMNEPISVFAHLELGRAYEQTGDKTKAATEYQKFLTLWKDADPDIPVYRQAKAEYAALHKK
jgi:DNA-binding winged helix-turn-helix (wHTH) protein/tetratricopeptide (TPR) repeat protein